MTKNFFGLLFWSCAILVSLGCTISIVTSNYMALSYAFYLLRYDGQPLADDSFVGPLFRTFCPNATISQFYAASIAVGLALGFFLVFNELFGSYDSWQALRLHRADGNLEQVRAFRWDIAEKLASLLLLATILGGVIAWDMELFRYRNSAQIAKLDSPGDAVDMVPWKQLLSQPSFALNVTRTGSWSYIALTCVMCLSLELTSRKARRYIDRLFAEIALPSGEASQNASDEGEFRGYDAAGHPVYEGTTPLAYDIEGNAINSTEPEARVMHAGNYEHDAIDPKEAEQQSAAADSTPMFVIPQVGRNRVSESRPISFEAAVNTGDHVAAPRSGALDKSKDETLPVIGTDERVSWSVAAKDSEHYYCDLVNGVIWSRRAYETLHGVIPNSPDTAKQEAA